MFVLLICISNEFIKYKVILININIILIMMLFVDKIHFISNVIEICFKLYGPHENEKGGVGLHWALNLG